LRKSDSRRSVDRLDQDSAETLSAVLHPNADADLLHPWHGHLRTVKLRPASVVFAVLLVAGCASTRVETTGQKPQQPLCDVSARALVLWGPHWRADQKDVGDRVAAADRGVKDFFDSGACFAAVEIRRLAGYNSAVLPSASEMTALALAHGPKPDVVVAVTVLEIGPVVKLLGSPALVEGGTEVVLEVRAVNVVTQKPLGDFRTHWQRGGAWVLKGVGSLAQDMTAALDAAMTHGR
jgi:hypothetical protein